MLTSSAEPARLGNRRRSVYSVTNWICYRSVGRACVRKATPPPPLSRGDGLSFPMQSPALLRLSFRAVFILLLTLLCLGCGDSRYQRWGGMSKEEYLARYRAAKAEEEKEEVAARERRRAESAARAERARRAPRSEDKQDGPKQSTEATPHWQANETGQEGDGTHRFPVDLDDWQRDDYLAAVRENHPRLEEAVAYLGKLHIGEADAARLLKEMLVLTLDGVSRSGSSRGRRSRGAVSNELVTEIIDGLVLNGTSTAKIALCDLFGRSEKATLLRPLIIETLAADSCINSQQWMFTLYRDADEFAVEEGAREAIRKMILDRADESAGSEFRRLLAEYCCQEPDVADHTRALELLTKPSPKNVLAQLILVTEPRVSPEYQSIAAQSLSRASTRLFELHRAAEGTASLDAHQFVRIWQSPFIDQLTQYLESIQFLDEAPDMIRLAATIPNPQVRSTLASLLSRRWPDGPAAVWKTCAEGNDGQAWSLPEPGMIPVLKQQIHGHYNRAFHGLGPHDSIDHGQRSAARLPRSLAPQGSTERSRVSRQLVLLEHEASVYLQWLKLSYQTLVHHFEAVSRNASPWPDGQGGPAERAEVMTAIEEVAPLYNSSIVVHTCHLQICGSPLPDSAPADARCDLDAWCLRATCRAKPAAVVGHYRRCLPGAKEYPTDDGLWFDRLHADPESEQLTSVDILIRDARPDRGPPVPDTERDMIIDILILCVPRPAATASAQAYYNDTRSR